MLFAFICAYWCPTLFPCQTMFAYITIIRWVSLVEQELHTLPKIDVPTRWLVSLVCSIFLCSVLFVISFLFFRQLSDLQFRSLISYVGSANFSSFNTLWLWTLFQPFNLMHLYFRQDTNVWGKARFISDLSPKKPVRQALWITFQQALVTGCLFQHLLGVGTL